MSAHPAWCDATQCTPTPDAVHRSRISEVTAESEDEEAVWVDIRRWLGRGVYACLQFDNDQCPEHHTTLGQAAELVDTVRGLLGELGPEDLEPGSALDSAGSLDDRAAQPSGRRRTVRHPRWCDPDHCGIRRRTRLRREHGSTIRRVAFDPDSALSIDIALHRFRGQHTYFQVEFNQDWCCGHVLSVRQAGELVDGLTQLLADFNLAVAQHAAPVDIAAVRARRTRRSARTVPPERRTHA